MCAADVRGLPDGSFWSEFHDRVHTMPMASPISRGTFAAGEISPRLKIRRTRPRDPPRCFHAIPNPCEVYFIDNENASHLHYTCRREVICRLLPVLGDTPDSR